MVYRVPMVITLHKRTKPLHHSHIKTISKCKSMQNTIESNDMSYSLIYKGVSLPMPRYLFLVPRIQFFFSQQDMKRDTNECILVLVALDAPMSFFLYLILKINARSNSTSSLPCL